MTSVLAGLVQRVYKNLNNIIKPIPVAHFISNVIHYLIKYSFGFHQAFLKTLQEKITAQLQQFKI